MTKDPTSFEEIAPTECRLQGSVFVSRRARTFLKAKLANSKFGTPEDLNNLVDCFDKSTKLRFRNPDEPSYIKFGGVRDKDLAVGIRSGQLKLPGSEVAALFEPSISGIINAIDQQRRLAKKAITSIFLVGGFAASDWLHSKLHAHMSAQGMNFFRPDSHVNKAVAEGALSFYLDHRVSARVAKKTYGLSCYQPFDPANGQHKKRAHKRFTNAAGIAIIPDFFSIILPKETRVSENKEFREGYVINASEKQDLREVQVSIRCYHGSSRKPKWIDTEPGQFSVLCVIEADTHEVANAACPLIGRDGRVYYQIEYSIVLLFGLTELKAQICWVENGQEKRSAARVVYDIENTIADMLNGAYDSNIFL
ncbi:hypothetical protein FIBSPDRAFT_1041019 [Athelia psychrophila]|uniref:Actin-like ATPase domain-containing protein n=1 Tax=Athelia psychrophila TaxID=1759441 RepID=A0A166PBC8_9AGAM|nr:hypothetical protein FIBSPDRAFT_1041019 [Fibularhizoctonia sp. CBS 109695]